MLKKSILTVFGALALTVMFIASIDAEVARREREQHGTEQSECLFAFNCWYYNK